MEEVRLKLVTLSVYANGHSNALNEVSLPM